MATKQNTKKLILPVIKYFYNQGPKVVCVLHKMEVGIFENLGITIWKYIYQEWMFIEQVLKGLALKIQERHDRLQGTC